MSDEIQGPGSGRSSEAAGWGELRKEIGHRNEQAHRNARKLLAEERERLMDQRERIAPSARGSRSSRVIGEAARSGSALGEGRAKDHVRSEAVDLSEDDGGAGHASDDAGRTGRQLGERERAVEGREHRAARREWFADRRDRVADEREREADEREREADERERVADEREHEIGVRAGTSGRRAGMSPTTSTGSAASSSRTHSRAVERGSGGGEDPTRGRYRGSRPPGRAGIE